MPRTHARTLIAAMPLPLVNEEQTALRTVPPGRGAHASTLARTPVRSLTRTPTRSFTRTLARPLDRSLDRLVHASSHPRSHALARKIARSHARKLARTLTRSSSHSRSHARSLARSLACSHDHPLARCRSFRYCRPDSRAVAAASHARALPSQRPLSMTDVATRTRTEALCSLPR
jgi:hypothetical protein